MEENHEDFVIAAGINMKRIRIYILIVLIAGLTGAACSKKLVPEIKTQAVGKTYDQATFDYVYTEGLRQKLMGNIGDAVNDFEQCIKLNPDSDVSYYEIAGILLQNGNTENGKKYLLKAFGLNPGNIWYGLQLANVYYQQKNLDSAIIYYDKLIKLYPEKENLELSLANLYTQDNKLNEARAILDKFDAKYGANENTTLSLVRVLVAEKKYREALEKVNGLLAQKPDDIVYNGIAAEIYRKEGQNEKASEIYSEVLSKNPENPEIQLSLCDFLISEKDYDEMFNLLNTIILNENITREQKVTLFTALIDNTDIQKEYGKKMEMALRILEANYKDDNIFVLMLPDFLQKENKKEDAAKRLEEIIKGNPDNYFAWERLLLVLYDMKDYKALEQKGEECATRFNRSILAKILYANAAMENKNFDTALDELRKAEILAGDDKDQKLQVLTMRADIYYRMKDFTKAFETFDQALAVNDTSITILNNYAYYLAEQNMRLKDAEKMAKSVVERAKNNATFLDTYAWVLYKRGDEKEAAKIMERILNNGQSRDAEYYEHYGFILKKMRKCSDAVKQWEKAVALDKNKTYLEKEIEDCKK